MKKPVDPKTFGIHRSVKIDRETGTHFIFRMDRKSRIIMKDGEKILANAEKIKTKVPDAVVTVSTTAPVCGKTRQFLAGHGITVETSKGNSAI
jgi:hypothetical protein